MSVTNAALQAEVETFFASYGDASGRMDAKFLAGQYAYPAHITSDAGTVNVVSINSKSDWTRTLEDRLFMYQRIGFQSLEPSGIVVTELSPLLSQARVHWLLNDPNGDLIYDFVMTYTLGRFEQRLLITSVIVHNEIPHYRTDTLAGGFIPREFAS